MTTFNSQREAATRLIEIEEQRRLLAEEGAAIRSLLQHAGTISTMHRGEAYRVKVTFNRGRMAIDYTKAAKQAFNQEQLESFRVKPVGASLSLSIKPVSREDYYEAIAESLEVA